MGPSLGHEVPIWAPKQQFLLKERANDEWKKSLQLVFSQVPTVIPEFPSQACMAVPEIR